MRDRPVTGRVTHNRAASSLSSRLGDVLQRRRSTKVTSDKTQLEGIKQGGVAKLKADALPLSDLLKKARNMARPARDTEYLHVSDLVGRCLRKIALIDKIGLTPQAQNLRLMDLLTFAQGDAIHDVLRQRATVGGGGAVWGKWACKCGTTKTAEPELFNDVDSERRCPACKGPLNVYQEFTIRDEEHMIVGNPDLVLYLSELAALHITELKSIAHASWEELARPIPEHVIQVLFYWYLMKKAGYRVTDKVSILYATKGWIFSGDPYKEFVIDAPSQVDRLKPYLEDALAVKASRAGGDLPPRICPTPNSPDAKKCELCQSCFGVSDDDKPVTISISAALGTRPTPIRRSRT